MITRAVWAAFIAAGICWAQPQVDGRVQGPGGVRFAGVTLRFTRQGAPDSVTAVTDQGGRFTIPRLAPGRYALQVDGGGIGRQRTFPLDIRGSYDFIMVDTEEGPSILNTRTAAMPPPPPPKPEARGSERGEGPRRGLTWNTWAEQREDQVSFRPVNVVTVGTDYRLMLDLATLTYGGDVTSSAVDSRLAQQLATEAGGTRLQVLVIPDPAFLRLASGEPPMKEVSIAGEAVRRALTSPDEPDPLGMLRQNATQPFSVQRLSYAFRAVKAGSAAIAISIWKDNVPVDELAIRFCINEAEAAAQCKTEGAVVSSLKNGAELVRPSGQRSGTGRRAAALHFVEMDPDRSVGVFRMDHWEAGRFLTWRLENIGERLKQFLDTAFLPNFAGADAAGRLGTGSELYNLLVPGANERSMIEGELTALLKAETAPPLLWVRLLAANARLPYAVPLGMMAAPIGGAPQFLGHRFRIETPLPVMDYRPVKGCIEKWTLTLPKGEPEAQADFEPALKAVRAWTGGCPGPDCLDTMEAFRTWIGSRDAPDSTPRALFLLAHHSAQGLYFTPRHVISEQGIARRFAAPSVAVFSACSVATPSAYRFAEHMAAQGMSAIVAPATSVPAELGGDYFQGLATKLAAHAADESYTLSHSHWETVRGLEEKWGGLALTYLLLGNGGLRVCSPPAGN